MKTPNNQIESCSSPGHEEYNHLLLLLKNYLGKKNRDNFCMGEPFASRDLNLLLQLLSQKIN